MNRGRLPRHATRGFSDFIGRVCGRNIKETKGPFQVSVRVPTCDGVERGGALLAEVEVEGGDVLAGLVGGELEDAAAGRRLRVIVAALRVLEKSSTRIIYIFRKLMHAIQLFQKKQLHVFFLIIKKIVDIWNIFIQYYIQILYCMSPLINETVESCKNKINTYLLDTSLYTSRRC